MILRNSYIFLSNQNKTEEQKKTEDGVVSLTVGKNVINYITQTFPQAIKIKDESDNPFKRIYRCELNIEEKTFSVTFIVNAVVSDYYLDIIVEGKTTNQIVLCLEQIQSSIEKSGIADNYIMIVSYDAVSEFYCNKIYPKLNELERNLRKLLYNTYVINFGRDYYRATISNDIQNKAKENIRAKGGEAKKEAEYLKRFFYSLEFGDISEMLFTESWTNYHENEKQKFLKKNKNLSLLSDEKLREAFVNYSPRSDWERYFCKKIENLNVKDILEEIRKYRNDVAHCKFFNKKQYTSCYKSINRFNKAIVSAIEITEDKDFTAKNNDSLLKSVAEISEAFNAFKKQLILTTGGFIINDIVPPAIKALQKWAQSYRQNFKIGSSVSMIEDVQIPSDVETTSESSDDYSEMASDDTENTNGLATE